MPENQDAVPYGFEDEQRLVQHADPTQDDVFTKAARVDAQHAAMEQILRENEALRAQLAAATPVSEATSKKLNSVGGEPISHHLHLVDGRVIPNHDGIATHYSEVVNGESVVTRVKNHFPANEADPASLFV